MVVFEIIGSEGKTPRFERLETDIVRIGRALDNDVIIDDPYIDAHHLEIRLDSDEGWVAVDQRSSNGSFKDKRTIHTAAIKSGDELLIGKTLLRIFAVDHVVAPARSLRDFEHRLLRLDSISTVTPLLLLVAALPIAALYLGAAGAEVKPDMLATAVIGGLVVPLAVAAFWSFLARLLRGESRFRVILNITLVFALAWALVPPLVQLAYYNFPGAAGGFTLRVLITIALFSAYLYIVMLITTRLKPRASQMVVGFVAACAIATHVVTLYSNRDEFRQFPGYDAAIYAPMLLLRSGQTPTEFLADLSEVFDRADELSELE